MLLTATWGKVNKKKHNREMNKEQFSDITRLKPQYEFVNKIETNWGKKRERKMTLL